MKGKKIVALFSIATFITLSSFITKSNAPYRAPETLKTIIIDPGHGLPDGGNEGSHSHESAVSLAIALKLGKLLEEQLPDCKILYTRKDENLPNGLTHSGEANRWRAQFANENHGDLFISIHCNSTPRFITKNLQDIKKKPIIQERARKEKSIPARLHNTGTGQHQAPYKVQKHLYGP